MPQKNRPEATRIDPKRLRRITMMMNRNDSVYDDDDGDDEDEYEDDDDKDDDDDARGLKPGRTTTEHDRKARIREEEKNSSCVR